MKKIIVAVIATLILGIGLLIFLNKVEQEEQRLAERYEKYNMEMQPHNVEKNKTLRALKKVEQDYEDLKQKKGTTQVIFTEADVQVYEKCYPIMDEFEYEGMIVLSQTEFPGEKGCISLEQFQELIGKGWSVCVAWNASAELSDWWPALNERIQALGVECLPVMYFENGAYSAQLDTTLMEMGFSIVIHHGEEDRALIQLQEEEGIWHVGSVGLMGEAPRLRMEEAIQQQGNISFLVGFEKEDELYNERSFSKMLRYFDTYEAEDELAIGNVCEARAHYRARLIGVTPEQTLQYEQERTVLEQLLQKIELDIAEIEEKYAGLE